MQKKNVITNDEANKQTKKQSKKPENKLWIINIVVDIFVIVYRKLFFSGHEDKIGVMGASAMLD